MEFFSKDYFIGTSIYIKGSLFIHLFPFVEREMPVISRIYEKLHNRVMCSLIRTLWQKGSFFVCSRKNDYGN